MTIFRTVIVHKVYFRTSDLSSSVLERTTSAEDLAWGLASPFASTQQSVNLAHLLEAGGLEDYFTVVK